MLLRLLFLNCDSISLRKKCLFMGSCSQISFHPSKNAVVMCFPYFCLWVCDSSVRAEAIKEGQVSIKSRRTWRSAVGKMEGTCHSGKGLRNHSPKAALMAERREEGVRAAQGTQSPHPLMKTHYIPHYSRPNPHWRNRRFSFRGGQPGMHPFVHLEN